MRQHLLAELKDLRESPGVQPMIDVVRDVSLQQAGIVRVMQFAAAIDEAFRHMPDFGDVEMRRDLVAIRQDETRKRVGMQRERGS